MALSLRRARGVRRRARLVPITFAALAGAAPNAHAHATSSGAVPHPPPRARLGSSVDVAAFDLGGRSGHYVTTALDAGFAPAPFVLIEARVPFHVLTVDNVRTESGLGDVDLRLRVIVPGTCPTLAHGLRLGLPTGEDAEGLGSPHPELSVIAAASCRVGAVTLHAEVSNDVSVHGSEEDHHVAPAHGAHGDEVRPVADRAALTFVDPHTDHELVYHAGGLVSVGRMHVNVELTGVTVLAEGFGGDTLIGARGQVGFRAAPPWRITAGFEAPLAGPERFSWKVGLRSEVELD